MKNHMVKVWGRGGRKPSTRRADGAGAKPRAPQNGLPANQDLKEARRRRADRGGACRGPVDEGREETGGGHTRPEGRVGLPASYGKSRPEEGDSPGEPSIVEEKKTRN